MGNSNFSFQIRLLQVPAFLLFLVVLSKPLWAGDFILEYLGENYKEDVAESAYNPIIYHSIQVKTKAGPKMLILTGDDNQYRTWLRQYIAQGKQFIAQVPDDQDDLFISSSAFEIDVTNVHPFNLSLFRHDQENDRMTRGGPPIPDDFPGRDVPVKKPADLKKKDEKRLKARRKVAQAPIERETQARSPAQEVRKKPAEPQRRRQEQLLKELALQRSLDQERLKIEFEKQRKEREKLFTEFVRQRAEEEQKHRQEIQQRWQALKARLMEDERIRNMAIDERNREIERRWQQLRRELQL